LERKGRGSFEQDTASTRGDGDADGRVSYFENSTLGTPLTTGEQKHLTDYKEPNYVETSLLPALAIYQMESLNEIEHNEFSIDTAKFIDSELSEIDSQSLDTLISSNQNDLFDKQLTIEIDNFELAKQLENRARRTPTTH
jgi:hypothetical protein